MSKTTKTVTEPKPEAVEPVRDNTAVGMDLETCVQRLQAKNPNICFAWPNKESVRFKHNGWRPITLIAGGDGFKEVASMEDAECMTGVVLCIRDKAVDIRARQKDEDTRAKYNRISRQERNLATTVGGVNDALKEISGGGLTAKPLSEADD